MPKSNRGGKYAGQGGSSQREVRTEIPIDKWGEFIETPEEIRDDNGNIIGYLYDQRRYTQEEDIHPISKKAILQEIDGWRMDDGTYGNEDTAIYLAYKDGTFVDASDLDGKPYKKSGIVGASISTGDYEAVWGGEYDSQGRFTQWQTWSPDGESGKPNSYSGYRDTGMYYVRVRETYNNPKPGGGYQKKTKIIRRSTVKAL